MSDRLFKSKSDLFIFFLIGLPLAMMIWTGAVALVIRVVQYGVGQ